MDFKLETGRWSKEESLMFEEAYKEHGHNWKEIAKILKTRSSNQVRSHAQKYLLKKQRENRLKELVSKKGGKPTHEVYLGWVFHATKAAQLYHQLFKNVAEGSQQIEDSQQGKDCPNNWSTL